MKEYPNKYPEILLLDATYNINNRNMPLASIMCIDGNGNGQTVAHSLLSNEKVTRNSVLNTFKETNMCTSLTE